MDDYPNNHLHHFVDHPPKTKPIPKSLELTNDEISKAYASGWNTAHLSGKTDRLCDYEAQEAVAKAQLAKVQPLLDAKDKEFLAQIRSIITESYSNAETVRRLCELERKLGERKCY